MITFITIEQETEWSDYLPAGFRKNSKTRINEILLANQLAIMLFLCRSFMLKGKRSNSNNDKTAATLQGTDRKSGIFSN